VVRGVLVDGGPDHHARSGEAGSSADFLRVGKTARHVRVPPATAANAPPGVSRGRRGRRIDCGELSTPVGAASTNAYNKL
jgi:hypothetical protein